MFSFYRFFRPLIFFLEPEIAHAIAINVLKSGLFLSRRLHFDPILENSVWGTKFLNPVGLAAGFDKNAEVVSSMFAQGYGFVEVGSVTPKPQTGNPKPRLFRLVTDQAIINRMGFNNEGHQRVLHRLKKLKNNNDFGPIGINLGKNKSTEDAIADYLKGITVFAQLSDYLVINVSSPNTPRLRGLQKKEVLGKLLKDANKTLNELEFVGSRPPLLLKVSPDLSERAKTDIADVISDQGIDGLVIANTSVVRPSTLKGRCRLEVGGLSGKPLSRLSTNLIADFYKLTEGKIPLIGVGGISSGADAYAKIRAGATLIQLYSAIVFEGPGVVRRINRELANYLRADGFKNISDAVGAD